MASHLSQEGARRGRLFRNSTYRKDARAHLDGDNVYDNGATILAGIQKRDKAMGRDHTHPLVQKQTQRVPGYKIAYRASSGILNFEKSRAPYTNQAHHIIPCEVFYDEKWTLMHLLQVLMSKYDINNEKNIVYLPQCSGNNHYMDYHVLPDHSRKHGNYNKKIIKKCTPIYNMVDEVLDEKDCEKRADIRDKILKKLEQIEESTYKMLRKRGTKPIG